MSQTIKDNSGLHLQAYSLAELAKLYQVCDKTFKKWLKPFIAEIGERQGRFYNINQVKTILDRLGVPGILEEQSCQTGQKMEKPGTNRNRPS